MLSAAFGAGTIALCSGLCDTMTPASSSTTMRVRVRLGDTLVGDAPVHATIMPASSTSIMAVRLRRDPAAGDEPASALQQLTRDRWACGLAVESVDFEGAEMAAA